MHKGNITRKPARIATSVLRAHGLTSSRATGGEEAQVQSQSNTRKNRNVCNVRLGNFRLAPDEDLDGLACAERVGNFMTQLAMACAPVKPATGKQLKALRDNLY